MYIRQYILMNLSYTIETYTYRDSDSEDDDHHNQIEGGGVSASRMEHLSTLGSRTQ